MTESGQERSNVETIQKGMGRCERHQTYFESREPCWACVSEFGDKKRDEQLNSLLSLLLPNTDIQAMGVEKAVEEAGNKIKRLWTLHVIASLVRLNARPNPLSETSCIDKSWMTMLDKALDALGGGK